MSEEIKKRKKSGPDKVPLFCDPALEPLAVRIVNTFVDRYYEKTNKFEFNINNVRVGQSTAWGLMYVMLTTEGIIKEGLNVIHYHKFLQENVNRLDSIVPRCKISGGLAECRSFYDAVYKATDEKVHISSTKQRRIEKYRTYFEEMKKIHKEMTE